MSTERNENKLAFYLGSIHGCSYELTTKGDTKEELLHAARINRININGDVTESFDLMHTTAPFIAYSKSLIERYIRLKLLELKTTNDLTNDENDWWTDSDYRSHRQKVRKANNDLV